MRIQLLFLPLSLLSRARRSRFTGGTRFFSTRLQHERKRIATRQPSLPPTTDIAMLTAWKGYDDAMLHCYSTAPNTALLSGKTSPVIASPPSHRRKKAKRPLRGLRNPPIPARSSEDPRPIKRLRGQTILAINRNQILATRSPMRSACHKPHVVGEIFQCAYRSERPLVHPRLALSQHRPLRRSGIRGCLSLLLSVASLRARRATP